MAIENFKRLCREHPIISGLLPLKFDQAISTAVAKGFTAEQLRDRVRWFRRTSTRLATRAPPGALYTGLFEATPDMKVIEGWPYKR